MFLKRSLCVGISLLALSHGVTRAAFAQNMNEKPEGLQVLCQEVMQDERLLQGVDEALSPIASKKTQPAESCASIRNYAAALRDYGHQFFVLSSLVLARKTDTEKVQGAVLLQDKLAARLETYCNDYKNEAHPDQIAARIRGFAKSENYLDEFSVLAVSHEIQANAIPAACPGQVRNTSYAPSDGTSSPQAFGHTHLKSDVVPTTTGQENLIAWRANPTYSKPSP